MIKPVYNIFLLHDLASLVQNAPEIDSRSNFTELQNFLWIVEMWTLERCIRENGGISNSVSSEFLYSLN